MPEHHANAGDDTRERIPTTVQVRHKYATVLDDTQGWRYSEEWGADFDRWLAERTAATVQAERERIGALLASVPDEYYPQDVFGGPFSTDESRTANEALREHGLSIDRISANVMRHAFRVAARLAREGPDDDE